MVIRKSIENNESIKDKGIRSIEFLFVLYIISLYLFVDNAQYTIISDILFISFAAFSIFEIIKKGYVYIHVYFWLGLLFLCYCALSIFWAIEPNIAFSKVKTVMQLFVLFILTYHFLYKDKMIMLFFRSL